MKHILIIVVAIVGGVMYSVSPGLLFDGLSFLIRFSPIWAPPLLIYIFGKVWFIYIRAKFIQNRKMSLLEVRLPREITKSPLAMEQVLTGIHFTFGESTWWDKYILGKARSRFSLELISQEGNIRFLIWTETFYKDVVESRIYSQYPEAEIFEVNDYTENFALDLNTMYLWGNDFKLAKPDPFPIKTYVDYGLREDPKEEFKIDPLTPLLEAMGNLGKGEQLWLQIVIRATKNEKKKPGTFFGKMGWKDEAQDEINKIKAAATPKGKDGEGGFFQPTKGQSDQISAIERSIGKPGFDCAMRFVYFAKQEDFKAINFVGMLGAFKQMGDANLNSIVPTGYLLRYDYPWQDYKHFLQNRDRRRVFEAYKRRAGFYPPIQAPLFVLSTEELATLFHFPGSVAQTPTLQRIPSKRGEAPPNLPV